MWTASFTLEILCFGQIVFRPEQSKQLLKGHDRITRAKSGNSKNCEMEHLNSNTNKRSAQPRTDLNAIDGLSVCN
jgi:hypothetical protein